MLSIASFDRKVQRLNQANSDLCLGTAEDFWQESKGGTTAACSPTRICGIFCSGANCPVAKLVTVREAGLMACPTADLYLAQGSLEPGETLPLKLKWILRREFWPQFQNLLKQGTEVGGTQVSQQYGARGWYSNSRYRGTRESAWYRHGQGIATVRGQVARGTEAGCIVHGGEWQGT